MKASVRLIQRTTLSVVSGLLAVGAIGQLSAAPVSPAFLTQTTSGGGFVPPSAPPTNNSGSQPSPAASKGSFDPAKSSGFNPSTTSVQQTAQGQNAPEPKDGTSVAPQASEKDARKAYLRDARRSLAVGDLKKTELILSALQGMDGKYLPNEDSPANVEALVNQVKVTATRKASLPKDVYDRSRSQLLIVQADGLLQYGEVELAEKLATEAKSLKVNLLPTEVTPDQILARAAQMRGQTPSAQVASKRDTVLNLTARAQLALDQGNTNQATLLLTQAKQIDVPESAFKPQDLRPWQVEAKMGNSANAGVVQTNGNGIGPGRASQAIAQEIVTSEGRAIFKKAMADLEQNNRTSALAGFKQAWNYQDELTPQEKEEMKAAIDQLSPVEQLQDSPNRLTLDSIEQEQQIIYQRMSNEVFREQQVAERLNTQKNPRAALTHLESLRSRVQGSQLTEDLKRKLITIVDRRIKSQQSFIESNMSDIQNAETNASRMAEVNNRRNERVETGLQIQALVEEFNKLMDQQRFSEAEMIARQANELAPETDIVQALVWKSKFATRMNKLQRIQNAKEIGFQDSMAGVLNSSAPMFEADENPLQFGDAESWREMSQIRLEQMQNAAGQSLQDLAIRNMLRNRKIDARFNDKPLMEVLELMGEQAGVNFNYDTQALADAGASKESPVTLNLREPISMESALNNLLRDFNLTYTVKDEVVLITTPQRKSQDVYPQTYYVADLVIPIPNFVSNPAMGPVSGVYNPNGLGGYANANANKVINPSQVAANGAPQGSINPIAMSQQLGLPGGGIPAAGGGLNPGSGQAGGGGFGGGGMPGAGGGAAIADFDPLIELIQNTIDPQSWLDTNGGPGTINEFRANLSLVISQTLENHERIQDLLESLRRLQDLQITIEVRFITLQDDFFERIGIDFDFDVEDSSGLPQPLTNIPDQVSGTRIFGRDAIGQATQDLDLSFTQDSFTSAVPTFGGFDVNTAANFGFAILSDIEVFFLIQASKGDTRSNVMQAPKVTLFNGQTASINDQSLNPFVTSVEPVVGDFAAAQRPIITLLAEGTSLSVNAVASDDRRFIRMTLTPFFSQIGAVDEFTFEGSTTTTTGTGAADPTNPANLLNNDASITTTGTTVQLPVFAFTTVNTTVSVPDGGTVLLGGIKRLSEGRNERGVPFLSNVPYVSRLFKNVGIGRESESLMMMVTPRIIIQDEEEIRQVGNPGGN